MDEEEDEEQRPLALTKEQLATFDEEQRALIERMLIHPRAWHLLERSDPLVTLVDSGVIEARRIAGLPDPEVSLASGIVDLTKSAQRERELRTAGARPARGLYSVYRLARV